jgi:inner membrane protein
MHKSYDYTTSAKMRPFYPFSINESALRAIYPFDPIVNFLPLLPVFIVAAEYVKNRNKWKIGSKVNLSVDRWSISERDVWSRKLNGLTRLHCFVNRNEKKLYASAILVLLLWTTVFPVAKIFLINYVSDSEGTRISYKNTYPISIDKFLAVYPYTNTHYKLLEISYWSGIKKSFYVEKVPVAGDVPDAQAYANRAGKLYSASVPQAIDYPAYSVSEDNGLVTVILSDARNPYVDKWPYFDTVYRFVFDRKSGEYEVYESHYGRPEKKLDKNYFE